MVDPYRRDPDDEPEKSWMVRLRAWWRDWSTWPQGPSHDEYRWLERLHERRFAAYPYERFVRLWCDLATVLETTPPGMDEDHRIDELLARSKHLADCLENLREFIHEQTDGHLSPDFTTMTTIGSLLDAMLPHLITESSSKE